MTRPWAPAVLAVLALVLALAPAVGLGAGASGRAEGGSDWLLGGNRPEDYAVELEPDGGRLGTAAALLRSTATRPRGFVSVMRWIDAAPHRGERVRFTAWLQSEEVAGWAGLWMRTDDLDAPRQTLAFDNMRRRPVRGTTDWTRHRVVLDVAEGADRIYYGVLLAGVGRVRADQLEIEAVDPEQVPTTGGPRLPPGPKNLDFDHPPAAAGGRSEEGVGPPP